MILAFILGVKAFLLFPHVWLLCPVAQELKQLYGNTICFCTAPGFDQLFAAGNQMMLHLLVSDRVTLAFQQLILLLLVSDISSSRQKLGISS